MRNGAPSTSCTLLEVQETLWYTAEALNINQNIASSLTRRSISHILYAMWATGNKAYQTRHAFCGSMPFETMIWSFPSLAWSCTPQFIWSGELLIFLSLSLSLSLHLNTLSIQAVMQQDFLTLCPVMMCWTSGQHCSFTSSSWYLRPDSWVYWQRSDSFSLTTLNTPWCLSFGAGARFKSWFQGSGVFQPIKGFLQTTNGYIRLSIM
jgi:hypothetical protein